MRRRTALAVLPPLLLLGACSAEAAPDARPTDAGSTRGVSTSTTSGSSTTTGPSAGAPTTATTTSSSSAPARASTSTTRRPSAAPKPAPSTVKPKPKPKPKPSPSPSPSPPPAGVAAQVLSLVNAERDKAGCRAVRTSSALQRAAQGHSADMAAKDYFSHTSKDGRTFADRIRAAGYTGGTIGENIAAGQASASAVMRSWMGSAGHKANILNCRFTALGVGYARGGSYGYYWTQDFGG